MLPLTFVCWYICMGDLLLLNIYLGMELITGSSGSYKLLRNCQAVYNAVKPFSASPAAALLHTLADTCPF